MEIDEITQKLNEFTNNEFGFVLRSAKLHTNNSCVIEFGYNDGSILNKQKRQECQLFLMRLLPEGFIYEIKFVKNYITEETIKNEIKEIIKGNFPALVYDFLKIDTTSSPIMVQLKIGQKVEGYAKLKNVSGFINEKLKETYLVDFETELIVDESLDDVVEVSNEDFEIEPQQIKTIEIKEISPLCGEVVSGPACYIRDQKEPSTLPVTLCGKIKFLKSKEYKKKTNNETLNNAEKTNAETEQNNLTASEEEPKKEEYVKKFYKFVLQDFTGEINCIYFANKSTQQNAEKLADGSEIIATGTLEEDKFSNGLSFKIKNISLCVLPENFVEPVVYKPEPEHYKYVFPEPYVSKEQVDLFSVLDQTQEEVAPYLASHDVVVFDFETTGLSATDCKIIEIGAVKIHGGKITEQFETFVNPEEHIDEESTKIHGIVDSDVADAPTYPHALQDFYKFTRNSTLVAYNIAFDFSFLSLYGAKAGYNFNDNPQIDALKLAVANVHGVKNYKLKTIADHLGVLLDNAHRAVYDAIATAEVFIKLAKYIN